MVLPEEVHDAEARKRFLRPNGFETCNGKVDARGLAPCDHFREDFRGGVTGTDKRFAIQPRRKNPAPIKMVPTTSASASAKPEYSGVPVAAKVTRPPAKIGVM